MFDVCMHARGSPLPYEFTACDLSKRFDLCFSYHHLGRLSRQTYPGAAFQSNREQRGVDRFQHGLDRLSVFDQTLDAGGGYKKKGMAASILMHIVLEATFELTSMFL